MSDPIVELEAVVLTDIVWVPGYAPSDANGDCKHDCRHPDTVVIAWGPTKRTYALRWCRGCNCRVWYSGEPGSPGGERPIGRWQVVR